MSPLGSDDSIAKLLRESQEMTRRFQQFSRGTPRAVIQNDVQRDTLEALDSALEPVQDGDFDLAFDDGGLRALGEFRPAAHGGVPLTIERIEAVLQERQIAYGIRWDAVRDALERCHRDQALVSGVVVAQGTPPRAARPEHFELLDRWTPRPTEPAPGEAVDFKARSPFLLVKKGDLIAVRVSAVAGSEGVDVRGLSLPFSEERVTTYSAGPLVAAWPEGLVAQDDGRLLVEDSTLRVSPVLVLDKGVDYRTGHVKFQGEVVIQGPVAPGFEIEAGGALQVTGVLDANHVVVGRDLVCDGGVIGNGLGRVEVSGRVQSKFLEHVYLLAQKEIHVETGVFNSVIKTKDRMTMGDRGVLVGGQVHAFHSVRVFQIGTPTGPATELFLGLDFEGMEAISWIRDRTQELHAQLKRVDAALPYAGAKMGDLMAAAKTLRLELVRLTDDAREQLAHLGQDEEAFVDVVGTIHPGTRVEICHIPFLVTQALKSVRFLLDKSKGALRTESLTNTTPSASAPKKR